MKSGKKVQAWEKERAKLKVKFYAWGITSCELHYPGCWNDSALGFAHARKRRNLKPHQLGEVILACNICHDKIESLPEEEMEEIVRSIIANRLTNRIDTPYSTWGQPNGSKHH